MPFTGAVLLTPAISRRDRFLDPAPPVALFCVKAHENKEGRLGLVLVLVLVLMLVVGSGGEEGGSDGRGGREGGRGCKTVENRAGHKRTEREQSKHTIRTTQDQARQDKTGLNITRHDKKRMAT